MKKWEWDLLADRADPHTCPICLDVHPSGERTCTEWADYWNALTPEQQRDEEAMIVRHVEDTR